METIVLEKPHRGFAGFPFMNSIHVAWFTSFFSLSSRDSFAFVMLSSGASSLFRWCLIFSVNADMLTPSTLLITLLFRNRRTVGTAAIPDFRDTSGTFSASILANFISLYCSSLLISSSTSFTWEHCSAQGA